MGSPMGMSDFEVLAVELDIVETILELAKHPLDQSICTAIFHGMDALCYALTVATYQQRRTLFDRFVKCNALDTIMKVGL